MCIIEYLKWTEIIFFNIIILPLRYIGVFPFSYFPMHTFFKQNWDSIIYAVLSLYFSFILQLGDRRQDTYMSKT